MTNRNSTGSSIGIFPALDGGLLVTVVLAGIAGTLCWEIWARIFVPAVLGANPSPANLVKAVFGITSDTLAEIIHFATGILAYPIGYIVVANPLRKLIVPGLPWWLFGLLFGVAIYVFGLFVMANLIGGQPAFMGAVKPAIVALIGHLLYALGLAAMVRLRLGRGS